MSNTNQNLLNLVLDPEDLTAIMNSLDDAARLLPESPLTSEQRISLNAISVDNKIFAAEVLDEMNTNPIDAINATYSKDNLANDIQLFEQAETILTRLMNLVKRLEDVKRMAGHEAYGVSTAVYGMYNLIANTAANSSAQNSYDRLKVRFQGQGRPEDTGPAEL